MTAREGQQQEVFRVTFPGSEIQSGALIGKQADALARKFHEAHDMAKLYGSVWRVKFEDMAKYLARSCPRCNDYLGIVMRKPARNSPLQAINGRCLMCGYRLAWLVVRGRKGTSRKSLSYGKENSR